MLESAWRASKKLTIEDEVKLEGKRLRPVLVASVNKVISTEFLSMLLLVLGMGQGPNLSTKSVSPEKSKVAKTTNSTNGNLLTRTATKTDQRRVGSQTSAQHRGSHLGREVVRNLEGEVLMGTNVTSISTLRDSAIFVLSTVCIDPASPSVLPDARDPKRRKILLVRTVVFLVSLAVIASQIGANLGANTNAIADLDILDSATNFHSASDDFVANAQRERDLAPSAGDGMNVRATDAASVDGNIDVVLLKLLQLKLLLGERLPSVVELDYHSCLSVRIHTAWCP